MKISRTAGFVSSAVFFFACHSYGQDSSEGSQKGFLPLSGRIFSDVYIPTQNNYPSRSLQQLSTSLWLQSDPKLTDSTSARILFEGNAFDANYSYLSGNTNVSHIEPQLREGYVSYSKIGFDLKVGKQIIPWGKSDAFNPTDYHTAKNFQFLNPDDEVRRQGSGSLLASITPDEGSSPWNLTGVFTPIIAQSRLLFPPKAISPNIGVSDPQAPPVSVANSEASAKLSYAGQGWDSSVSGFTGWNHTPQFQLASQSIAPGGGRFTRQSGLWAGFSTGECHWR